MTWCRRSIGPDRPRESRRPAVTCTTGHRLAVPGRALHDRAHRPPSSDRAATRPAAAADEPNDDDHDDGTDDGDDDRLDVDHVPALAARPEADEVRDEPTDESTDDAQHDMSDD